MESDPYELTDQVPQVDYQNYYYSPHEQDENLSTPNSRIPYRNSEMEERGSRRQEGDGSQPFQGDIEDSDMIDENGYSRNRSKDTSQEKRSKSMKRKYNEEQHQSKFSFHPEINELPKDIYEGAGSKIEISKEEQWERILRPKTEVIQERERQKYEKEAHEEKRKSADDECTFIPDVAESVAYLKGDKVAQKPIHERLGDIMKQKQEFLQKLRVEAEVNNKDLAFKPKVGEHSQILAEAKQEIKDVTERLMKDAADKIYKKMKMAEEHESQLTSMCTFKPNVNPISRSNDEILLGNDMYMMQKDIVTRQYLMADIKRENLQKRAVEIMAEEGCTFAPKINKISEYLIEADPQRANENLQEKVERLSKIDAQKKEIFQEQMKKAHYDQFSFKPQINKISKDIGKRTSIEDLADNRGVKEHIQILRERSIDNMLSECSFRPNINRKKKYETVEPLYKDEEKIMDNVNIITKKKEIKYDQQRKIEEYDEMKECTFKPRINRDVDEEKLRPKLGECVAGVSKFMQIRERHKKLQEEKKKREEEVFNLEKKYSATKHEGFTSPQPFNLSKGVKGSIRNAKVAQEMKEKFNKEYTFKPNTNEGKNREIINSVISNGGRAEN